MAHIEALPVLLRSQPLEREDEQRVGVPADGADLLAFVPNRLFDTIDCSTTCFTFQRFDCLLFGISERRRIFGIGTEPPVVRCPVDLRFSSGMGDRSELGERREEGPLFGLLHS